MGVMWDGSFHSVWVMGTLLSMMWVRQLLFGNKVTVGEVARVQYMCLLSEPETARTLGE